MVNLNIIFESTCIENEPSKFLLRAVINEMASLTELRKMGTQSPVRTLMEMEIAGKDPAYKKISFIT